MPGKNRKFHIEDTQDDDDPILFFGVWKGLRISEVPSGYLLWIRDNLRDLDEDFLDAVDSEIAKRPDWEEMEGYEDGGYF